MLRRLAILLIVFAGLAASAPAASSPRVKIGDDFFGVKRLTVRSGARVTWSWEGVLPHNVTVRSGPVRFHSRTQARGSYSHAFTRKGTYSLYCSVHPFMRMTVVVR